MSDNVATLAGFTQECEAHTSGGKVLFLLVRPQEPAFYAGRSNEHFTQAWDTDAQAFVTLETHLHDFYKINSWPHTA
jgi:hypothetical protein